MLGCGVDYGWYLVEAMGPFGLRANLRRLGVSVAGDAWRMSQIGPRARGGLSAHPAAIAGPCLRKVLC